MPHPLSKLISFVYDFKTWMEPHLAAIVGHSKYLVFKFTLNATSGKAEMHYKRFSSNPWEPEGAGVSVISVCDMHLLCAVVCKHDVNMFVPRVSHFSVALSFCRAALMLLMFLHLLHLMPINWTWNIF